MEEGLKFKDSVEDGLKSRKIDEEGNCYPIEKGNLVTKRLPLVKNTIKLRKWQVEAVESVIVETGLSQREAIDLIMVLGMISFRHYKNLNCKTPKDFDRLLSSHLPKSLQQLRVAKLNEFLDEMEKLKLSYEQLELLRQTLSSVVVEKDVEWLKKAILLKD